MAIFSAYFKTILEPSERAQGVREYFELARQASLRDSFYERHFDTFCFGCSAWISSIFDSFRFSSRGMSHLAVHVYEVDSRALIQDFKRDSSDVLSSIKLDVILPIFLFAGIFFPKEIFGRYEWTHASPIEMQDFSEQLDEEDTQTESPGQIQPSETDVEWEQRTILQSSATLLVEEERNIFVNELEEDFSYIDMNDDLEEGIEEVDEMEEEEVLGEDERIVRLYKKQETLQTKIRQKISLLQRKINERDTLREELAQYSRGILNQATSTKRYVAFLKEMFNQGINIEEYLNPGILSDHMPSVMSSLQSSLEGRQNIFAQIEQDYPFALVNQQQNNSDLQINAESIPGDSNEGIEQIIANLNSAIRQKTREIQMIETENMNLRAQIQEARKNGYNVAVWRRRYIAGLQHLYVSGSERRPIDDFASYLDPNTLPEIKWAIFKQGWPHAAEQIENAYQFR